MIIHIGNNNYIFESNIIAILDKKVVESTRENMEFINTLIQENNLIGNLDSNVKSYIIVSDEDRIMAYTSNISSKSLSNRKII